MAGHHQIVSWQGRSLTVTERMSSVNQIFLSLGTISEEIHLRWPYLPSELLLPSNQHGWTRSHLGNSLFSFIVAPQILSYRAHWLNLASHTSHVKNSSSTILILKSSLDISSSTLGSIESRSSLASNVLTMVNGIWSISTSHGAIHSCYTVW